MELTHEQREVVEYSAGKSLIVSAAAGSGKTRVLVEHLLGKLEEKDAESGRYNDIDDFLVITFTKAAAAELRTRVADSLSTRLEELPAGDEEKRAHLRTQRRRLYYCAHICTIDSFCLDLLRQYAWIFDLDPGFRICDAVEEKEIAAVVLNDLLEEKYSKALEEPSEKESDVEEQQKDSASEDSYEGKESFSRLADFALSKTYQSNLEEMILYIHQKLEICDDPEGWIQEYCCEHQIAADDGQEEKLDAEQLFADVTISLLKLVREFDDRLIAEKMRIGALTYSDIERLVVRLLKDQTDHDGTPICGSARQQVQGYLRGQFKEIMIDEYQDTNKLQESLFEALSADGENFFLVGDVKQSIYRFRNADPTIFLEKFNSWPSPENAEDGQGIKMTLSNNFRSRPQILSAVNEVFSAIMTEDFGEVNFCRDGKFAVDPEAETDDRYNVEMDVLIFDPNEKKKLPDPYLMEARLVARRIREMVRQEGDPAKEHRLHVEEKDIAILIPSLHSIQSFYVQALSEAGIRVELEEEIKFRDFIYNNTEISVAVSLLQMIDNPYRDIPLLSVLNSPVFDFTPDLLAEIRTEYQQGCFYEAMLNSNRPECFEFIREMDRLRNYFRDMPVHILLENLYRETHMREIFGAMQNGETRLENLDALSDKARKLENAGVRGLSAFLCRVDTVLNDADIEDRVIVSHGAGGVKLMSIHHAKGLEFPVVFLCGLGRKHNDSEEKKPMLFHIKGGLGSKFLQVGDGWRAKWNSQPYNRVKEAINKDTLSERVRLLYVGMTRAQDKLIMTMNIGMSQKKLADLMKDSGPNLSSDKLRKEKTMAKWLLLATLYKPAAGVIIKEGQNSDHDEVWEFNRWEYDGPPKDEYTQLEDNPPDVEKQEIDVHEYAHENIASRPAKLEPSQLDGQYKILDHCIKVDKGTPNNFGDSGSDGSDRFPFPESLGQKSELSAAEKGTATHKVMQYIDFDHTGSIEEIKSEIMRLQEENFITKEEADCASPQWVFQFFSSWLGKQILATPEERRHREYRFSFLLPWADEPSEETMIQGIMDCWFQSDDGEVCLLDFKTDRAPNPDKYSEQIKSYSLALKSILDKDVSRKFLYFFSEHQVYEGKEDAEGDLVWHRLDDRGEAE